VRYQKLWLVAATVVLTLGLLVACCVAVVAAPGPCGALLAGVVVCRQACRIRFPDTAQRSLLAWIRMSTPEVQVAVGLLVVITSSLGLATVVGASVMVLVWGVVLGVGLPLILPGWRARQRPAGGVDDWDSAAEDELWEPGGNRPLVVADGSTPRPAVPSTGPGPDGPGWTVTSESELTTTELCHAWRASYRAMLLARDAADVARMAAARERYLDALQRRDPAGFERWLSTEPAAGGDPGDFVT
jgi:hypothetical protein